MPGGAQGAGARAGVGARRQRGRARERRPRRANGESLFLFRETFYSRVGNWFDVFFYSQFLWDAASSEAVGKRKVSDGHVTALRWTQRRGYEAVMQGGDVLISGGQDGVVKAWDPRVGKVSYFNLRMGSWHDHDRRVLFTGGCGECGRASSERRVWRGR